MRTARMRFFAFCLALVASAAAQGKPAMVKRLEVAIADGRTRFVINLDGTSAYRMFTLSSPDRLVLDVNAAQLAASVLPLPAGAGVIRQVRVANRQDGSVRIVLDLLARSEPQGVVRRVDGAAANRIVVDLVTASRIAPAETLQAATAPAAPGPEPASVPPPAEVRGPDAATGAPFPVASAPGAATRETVPAPAASAPVGRDVVIAIDAGHGGKDPGAHGPRGVREKDVTLKIARQLAQVINSEPGMRAVLTRSRDEFVPLRTRMERARAAQADLFVSIHADAVRNRRVKGSSVYVLNEKGATDEAARRLAARENAADLIGGVSLGDKDRTLASVLMDLSQNASLSSSIEAADDVLAELRRVGIVRKPRVMQAPFMVLKSPDVPSMLVETAYISNPEEERRLDSSTYRNRLAAAIFAGVRTYFSRNPPRGTLLAERGRPQPGAGREHVIGKGETLSVIATRYNVSVRRLRDANRLTSDRVAVGQVLRIPSTRET